MAAKQKRMTKTLIVGPFRMAFPALIEPEQTDNGERYKVTALFPPDYDLKPIEDALYDVMEDAFGPKRDWPNGRNDVTPMDKLYDAGTKSYAGFEKGWHAMSMSSQDAPGVIDAKKNEVMSKREVYGGRWARAQIAITTYDNKSKGVAAYLNHVQLLDHDEAFSGRGDATKAFDEYEVKDRREDRGGRDRDESRDKEERGGRDTREDTRSGSRAREDNSRDRERGGSRDDDRSRARGRDDEGHDRDRGRESRVRGDEPKRDTGRDEGRTRDRSPRDRGDDWD